MATTALGDIILSDRGSINPKRIGTHNLQVNWEVSRVGALSCFVMRDTLIAAGVTTTDLRGKWVYYEHATAGDWLGIVMASSVRDGEVEIAAASFEISFYRKIRSPTPGTRTDTPGGIFRTCVYAAMNAGGEASYLVLDEALLDTSGVAEDYEFSGGEDLLEVMIPMITDELDREWQVRASDRKVVFGRRVGTDKSATVRLVAGVDINTYSWSDDLYPCLNDLSGKGRNALGGGGPNSPSIPMPVQFQANEASQDRFGAFQAHYVYSDTRSRALVNLRLEEIGNQFADPRAAVTIEVNNDAGAWGRFREGDDITVELGSAGITGSIRVKNRALDTDRGVMVVSGEGER